MTFLLVSIFLFITAAIVVPKRLNKSEIYCIALFSIILGFVTDIILDLKYHLYGYFMPGVQLLGFLPILFLFPSSGVLFMNSYPYKRSYLIKTCYIVCWTIFCLFFEYLSILSGYFYHNGWTYVYSAITYPFLFMIHLWHLKLFRKYVNNSLFDPK